MSDFEIPDAVAQALNRGRTAYAVQDYRGAQVADVEALALAEAARSEPGRVRALRLLGLCSYRLGDCELSAERLELARSAAMALGWEAEELLVCNHLGATYRKLARLDAADAMFRDALQRADPREHLVARARLLGSYGAFLDDLGEVQAAGEHYARCEELLGLLDDPIRLANARGLVSRAHRMRGDFATALAKAEDERRLGVGHRVREGRGWLHIGQALAQLGDLTGAEHALDQARDLLDHGSDPRTPIEVAVARGRFFLECGRIHDAHDQVTRALEDLKSLSASEHEHRAGVARLAAEVAAAAGLHGEALWHLATALDCQLVRFDPIADPRLRRLTQNRRRELAALADRLVHEAGIVERAADEQRLVQELLVRLGGDAPSRPTPAMEPVDTWRIRVREHAEERWRRLLPGVFGGLTEGSRADLILVDVVSQGPVGDLSRSVFLLFATIERELGQRVIEPLRRGFRAAAAGTQRSMLSNILSRSRPVGLGEMVEAILQDPQGFSEEDPRIRLERMFPGHRLAGLGALSRNVLGVDDASVGSPLSHRNAIAHGRPWQPRRTDADAVRRVLTLGSGTVLSVVTGVPDVH